MDGTARSKVLKFLRKPDSNTDGSTSLQAPPTILPRTVSGDVPNTQNTRGFTSLVTSISSAVAHHVYSDRKDIPYRHDYLIGHGGQGTVDAVQRSPESSDQNLYARKSFVLSKKPKPRELDEVLKEFKIAGGLRHLHIVRLLATYQCNNTYAMIMEPVAEGNLALFLSDTDEMAIYSLERDRQLKNWFQCLATALWFLHAKGVLHRDIKPQNILTMGDNILLTDFGISKEFEEQTISKTTDTRGTTTYRSPEQNNWQRPGRRSDVFSLGAVFLEILLVGRGRLAQFHAFRGGPYCENLGKVHQTIERYKIDPNVAQDLSMVNVIHFCGRMMHPDRTKRPYAEDVAKCWQSPTLIPLIRSTCDCVSHFHG